MTIDAIITWIIVGGAAGLVAQWLVGGVSVGCLGSVLLGILGAFVGGWLFSALNISIGTGLVNDIVTATAGAALVLVLSSLFRQG